MKTFALALLLGSLTFAVAYEVPFLFPPMDPEAVAMYTLIDLYECSMASCTFYTKDAKDSFESQWDWKANPSPSTCFTPNEPGARGLACILAPLTKMEAIKSVCDSIGKGAYWQNHNNRIKPT